ncbi:tetratricopeptide repeat protein [Candidatus Sumerlaeota bacterium]|nr:tetratricopeptide repeat protein [Candidatus Sumerlaeota bacterium]
MGRFSRLEIGDAQPQPEPPEEGRGEEISPAAREEEEYNAAGYLRRGHEHFFRREFHEALRRFSQALRLDSRLHEAWVGQIDALIEQGQLREAEHTVTNALTQFPDDPTLLSLRGVLLARQGMAQRAIKASDYALSVNHTLRAWICRGEILLASDRHGSSSAEANANFCLTKALEQIPDGDWENLARVGLAYLRSRRHAKALDVFRRACLAAPDQAQLWRHVAECQEALGYDDQAISTLQRALEIEPGDNATEDWMRRLSKRGPISRLLRKLRRSTRK